MSLSTTALTSYCVAISGVFTAASTLSLPYGSGVPADVRADIFESARKTLITLRDDGSLPVADFNLYAEHLSYSYINGGL